MYKKVKLSSYEQEKFLAYTNFAASRFEVSVKVKCKDIKNVLYLYKLSKCVNSTKELKLSVLNNEIIEFDFLNPAYVLSKDENIVNSYTTYSSDYLEFYKNYQDDYELFLNTNLCFCLKQAPLNCFYVSSFPKSFNSFSLHLKNGFDFYQPIFTNYKDKDELVIFANFHHAFFDLQKAYNFFELLKEELSKKD